MQLYEKVRAYRISKGISQTFVANSAKMNVKRYNYIEKGRQKMTANDFEIICRDGLGIDPAYFFDSDVLNSKNNETKEAI